MLSLLEVLHLLTPLLVWGSILTLLARVVLSRWLLPRLAHPTGPFYTLLRFPGNLVHESSHALAFLLAGFGVAEFRSCLGDPARRGYVRAGGPWAPWAHPGVAALMAGPAPLFAGSLVLHLLADWTSMPPLLAGEVVPGWPPDLPLLATAATPALKMALDLPWGPVPLLVFLLLALSVGAEMAPSGEDMAQVVLPFLGLVAGLTLVGWLGGVEPIFQPLKQGLFTTVDSVIGWLQPPLVTSVVVLSLVAVILTPWVLLRR